MKSYMIIILSHTYEQIMKHKQKANVAQNSTLHFLQHSRWTQAERGWHWSPPADADLRF